MSNQQNIDALIYQLDPQGIIGALLDHVRHCIDRELYATGLSDLRQAENLVPFVTEEHREQYADMVGKYIDEVTYELDKIRNTA